MGYIRTTKKVDNRNKKNTNICTPFGCKVMELVNGRPQGKTAFEKFVDAMRAEKNELYVYRDDKGEFMAYTRFGTTYEYFQGMYSVRQYPIPSNIPTSIIRDLIEEEEGANDWDNVADMAHFLTLSSGEKDKEGFSFYNWIWEEGTLDNMTFLEHIGEDEEDLNFQKLQALAALKKAMGEY